MNKVLQKITGWNTGKFKTLAAVLILATTTNMDAQAPMLVPFTGSNSIALCTGTFGLQDHAGTNNYSNNANGYTVLQCGAGGTISINGNYDVETNWDDILIYSGAGTGGTLLQTYTGLGVINFTNTPGQVITVRFTSDGAVIDTGFDLVVTYTGNCFYPACTAAPGSNTVVPTQTLVCPVFGTSSMSLALNYSLSATNYSFQISTQGPLGPFTNIPGANGQYLTGVAYTTPTLNATTWYQVAMSCMNGGITTTTSPIQVSVAATTTNTVPYFEGFEGITTVGELPNCSWQKTDAYQTKTQPAMFSAFRQARTGNKFAEFDGSNYVYTQTRYFYSNGVYLNAGITYSASVWYKTPGYTTWINLTLLYGPNQSPTGLTTLATVPSPNSSSYLPLTNTFNVTTSGIYYAAIRATDNYSGSQLVWDDLAITAPCTFSNNAAAIALTGSASICAGQSVVINASGASSYTWSSGVNTSAITVSPLFTTTYSITGTNPLSGCFGSSTKEIVVNQLPPVNILAFKTSVCAGEPVTMQAVSANSYTWSSNGSNSSVITVTPTQNVNTYTVIGSNVFGCTNQAAQTITVNPLPAIAISGNTLICQNQATSLNASGASTYVWIGNLMYAGSSVVLSPAATTTYFVEGTDSKGCKGSTLLTVAVDPCTGIASISGSSDKVSVYPNPNNGLFTIELANGLTKTIEIIDVTGRVVLTNTTSNNVTDVNISTLANGVYYVKVRSENATEVVKIIKH